MSILLVAAEACGRVWLARFANVYYVSPRFRWTELTPPPFVEIGSECSFQVEKSAVKKQVFFSCSFFCCTITHQIETEFCAIKDWFVGPP